MSEYLILFPYMCMLMQDVLSSLDLEICADIASLWCQAWSSKMHRRLQMRVCLCRRTWGCHRDIWARLRSCLVMMIHICHVEMSKYWCFFFFLMEVERKTSLSVWDGRVRTAIASHAERIATFRPKQASPWSRSSHTFYWRMARLASRCVKLLFLLAGRFIGHMWGCMLKCTCVGILIKRNAACSTALSQRKLHMEVRCVISSFKLEITSFWVIPGKSRRLWSFISPPKPEENSGPLICRLTVSQTEVCLSLFFSFPSFSLEEVRFVVRWMKTFVTVWMEEIFCSHPCGLCFTSQI